MDELILKTLLDSVEKHQKVALVTVTEVKGSTPRDAGALMLVWENGNIAGSIGGGKVEFYVIQEAVAALKKNADCVFDHSLTPTGDLEMQCGGAAKGFIKIFGAKNRVVIAGGGHIGQKLVELAQFLGFYTIVFDDREDYVNKESLKKADELIIGSYDAILDHVQMDHQTFVMITTKGHLTDIEAVKQVLKTEAKYIGLIGSTHKQLFARRELIKAGFTMDDLARIYGPIGLDIANQMPEEIAVSIMSEVLLVKNNSTLAHRKLDAEMVNRLVKQPTTV